MFSIKPGVKLLGLTPPAVIAIIAARDVYDARALALTLTSAVDGRHSAGSLHYKGCAVDLRTRDVPTELRAALREEIADRLGAEFDVILEEDHIHIEWDPKR